jgi:hypothetical protein
MRLALFVGLTTLAVLQAAPDLATPASAQQVAMVAQSARHARPARTAQTRPQIRVSPRYPYRYYSSPYPLPSAADYPGPNGVRQCSARYVTEARPSGTVVVPRMNCVWVARR